MRSSSAWPPPSARCCSSPIRSPLAAGRLDRRDGRARGQGRRRPAAARGAERARGARGRLPRRPGRGARPRRARRAQACWCCSATPIRSRAARTPSRWRDALQRAESVVVSTLFPNEATCWAHVILPATATLEKEGSTTNLEGRVAAAAPDAPAAGRRRLRARVPRRARSPARARRCRRTRRPSTGGSPPPSPSASRAGRRPPRRARRRAHAAKGSRRRRAAARRPRRDAPTGCRIVAYRPLVLGAGRRPRRAPALPAARRDRARTRRRHPARPRRGPAGRRRPRRAAGRAGRCGISRTQPAGAVRVPWTGAPVAGRRARSRQRARRARRVHPHGDQGVRARQPADGLLRDHDRDRAQADRPPPGRATARTASGPIGLLQPIADLGKLAQKQHAVPVGRTRAPVPGRAVHLAVRGDRRVRRDPVRRRGDDPGHRLADLPVHRRLERRRPVHRRDRLDGLLRHADRRLGLGQQVLAARRPARRRAARQLRGRVHDVGARRRHAGRHAVAERHRRGAGRLLVHRPADRRLRDLLHRRARREQPAAVRPRRGRRRDRRRLPHRVRRPALRDVRERRVRRGDHAVGARLGAVPRRLARAVSCPARSGC